MILDAIIAPISDLSTLAAQAAVERIAERSSLARDGWALTGIRVLVACVVSRPAPSSLPSVPADATECPWLLAACATSVQPNGRKCGSKGDNDG